MRKLLTLLAVMIAMTGCKTIYKADTQKGTFYASSIRKFGELTGRRCVTEPATADARCETKPDGTKICYGMRTICHDIDAKGVDRQSPSVFEEMAAEALRDRLNRRLGGAPDGT